MAFFRCSECRLVIKGDNVPGLHAFNCSVKDGTGMHPIDTVRDNIKLVEVFAEVAKEVDSAIEQLDCTLQFAPKQCREAMLAAREVLVKVKEQG